MASSPSSSSTTNPVVNSSNIQDNNQSSKDHDLEAMQRNQQQELIKLLAQHFHHQFYQLANNNNNNNPLLQATAGATNYQQRSNYSPTTNLVEPGPNNFSSFNGNNLINDQLLHHSRLNRSPLSNTSPYSMGTNESNLLDFTRTTNHQTAGSSNSNNSPYPFNDLNLLNALGFNLTNNQIVLSLQQQQQSLIIQAAEAARQYELPTSDELITNQQIERDLRASNRIFPDAQLHTTFPDNNIESFKQQQQQHHCQSENGKGLLKFSINTILGKSSTNSAANDSLISLEHKKSAFNEKVASKSMRVQANHSNESPSTSDIDDCSESQVADLGSDSNSRQTSTTSHKSNNSANHLFNQTTLQTNPNAHLLMTNNATNGQQTHNQTLRLHQQSHNNHHHHTLSPFLTTSGAFPWTVAARGKPRRGMMRRAVFSDSQRVGLEKRFQLQKYISKPDRKKLAEKLGLRDSQVKIWFQNRRMKWRNSKERELLSAGGSREQTLPTRNNPNPDLSDVGETIKRLQTSTLSPASANQQQAGK